MAASGSLHPPAGFRSRPLAIHEVPAGSVWRRLYQSRYPNPLGFGFASSRFSDPRVGIPDTDRFGIVYLGSTLKVCFLEAILRDRGNGRLGEWPIEVAELDLWTCAEIAVVRPLRLVDLRGDALIRMGIPTDAARGASHTLGQLWSAAIWAHEDRPDGLIYSSRLNEEPNLAVFDRALAKLAPTRNSRLLDCRPDLASVLRELEIALL